ncbi:MAG: hypothetical protein ACYDBZ_13735 [Steroidobacteraceae bacterium]
MRHRQLRGFDPLTPFEESPAASGDPARAVRQAGRPAYVVWCRHT